MVNYYGNSWFHVKKPAPSAEMRLFCFPYAGGSANIFHDWAEHLPSDVEVVAVQYPGRGSRYTDTLIHSCEEMVATLLPQIRPLANKPFALFGHSNGGLVSFELARALRAEGNLQQCHHFISAKRAIHLPRTGRALCDLPHNEFVRELESLGGTPHELLGNRQIMELFLPVLRADFSLSETFQYRPSVPLRTSATLLYGRQDHDIPESDVMSWAELIDGEVNAVAYDGGHFFINSHRRQVLQFLNFKLGELLAPFRRRLRWA